MEVSVVLNFFYLFMLLISFPLISSTTGTCARERLILRPTVLDMFEEQHITDRLVFV